MKKYNLLILGCLFSCLSVIGSERAARKIDKKYFSCIISSDSEICLTELANQLKSGEMTQAQYKEELLHYKLSKGKIDIRRFEEKILKLRLEYGQITKKEFDMKSGNRIPPLILPELEEMSKAAGLL